LNDHRGREGPTGEFETKAVDEENDMRTSEAFVLGAMAGAAVAWFWGRGIADYLGEQTRGVRVGAADGLRAADEKAGQVLDRSGHTLRRAEEFLHDTKEHVSEALRAGQEAIRPAPRTREA
jgi:gas vesicle protein